MSEAKEEEPASPKKTQGRNMGMLNSPNSVIPTGVKGPAVYSITSAGGWVAHPYFSHLKLWLPRPCILCKGWYDAADSTSSKPAQAFDLSYLTTTVAAPSFA